MNPLPTFERLIFTENPEDAIEFEKNMKNDEKELTNVENTLLGGFQLVENPLEENLLVENRVHNNTNINNTYTSNTDYTKTTTTKEKKEPVSGVVVVDTHAMHELILKYLNPKPELSAGNLKKIASTKGFTLERLEQILQVAKTQNIKNVVGWLVKAIENPDFDFNQVEADAAPNTKAKTKSKIVNYTGRAWDHFDVPIPIPEMDEDDEDF